MTTLITTAELARRLQVCLIAHLRTSVVMQIRMTMIQGLTNLYIEGLYRRLGLSKLYCFKVKLQSVPCYEIGFIRTNCISFQGYPMAIFGKISVRKTETTKHMESGMVFEGTTGVYERTCHFSFANE